MNILIVLFATAVGVLVANLYYAQPLLGIIAKSFNIAIDKVSIITTITQLGYALGVFLIAPLLDILENKKLILFMVIINIFTLILMGFSNTFLEMVYFSFLLGISASGAQMIVPFAANISSPEKRGIVVGQVISGLLFGIMLSRPISSFLSTKIGWNGVFFISAILASLLTLIFIFIMPKRKPDIKLHYIKLIISMLVLLKNTSSLKERGFYQFICFGSFSLFWIVAPLVLINKFHYTQVGVAIFSLIGVAGGLIAPIAGKMADKNMHSIGTTLAFLAMILSTLIASIPIENPTIAFILFAICGAILDLGVNINAVLNISIIYKEPLEARARLNSLYIFIFFIGGSFGSLLGGYMYQHLNYNMAFLFSSLLCFIAFLVFKFMEFKRSKI